MRRTRIAAVGQVGFIFLVLSVTGCRPTSDGDGARVKRSGGEIEDLLALPYAGWSDNDDRRDGLVLFDAERSQPGYTLISVYGVGRAILVTHDGEIVRSWAAPNHANLLPNGDIITLGADRTAGDGAALPRRLIKRMSWSGETLWRHDFPAHHEVAPTADERLMALTFQLRPAAELHDDPEVQLRDNEIALLTPDGELIETLSIYELVRRKPDLFPLIQRRVAKEQVWIDLFHCNSLQWMTDERLFDRDEIYGPDNVLFCSRHQNRVAIVNMRTRGLLWAWGEDELSGPHDATLLPSGNILMLDNGLKQGRSRAVEMNPLTGEIVWEFEAPNPGDFFTPGKGSAQRLANGNTLIGNADSGEVFEVTSEGDVVWRYLAPERDAKGRRATIVRARRFDNEVIEALEAAHGD